MAENIAECFGQKPRGSEVETATPEIDLEKCTGCGDCVDACPTGAVGVINGKLVLVNPEACNYCTDCEGICPPNAIRCPFLIVLV